MPKVKEDMRRQLYGRMYLAAVPISERDAMTTPRFDVSFVDSLSGREVCSWSGSDNLPSNGEKIRNNSINYTVVQVIHDSPTRKICEVTNDLAAGAPDGLCGNREDHKPHLVTEGTLAPFNCCADESMRLPFAAEERRKTRLLAARYFDSFLFPGLARKNLTIEHINGMREDHIRRCINDPDAMRFIRSVFDIRNRAGDVGSNG